MAEQDEVSALRQKLQQVIASRESLRERIEKLPVFHSDAGGECVNRTAVLLAIGAE